MKWLTSISLLVERRREQTDPGSIPGARANGYWAMKEIVTIQSIVEVKGYASISDFLKMRTEKLLNELDSTSKELGEAVRNIIDKLSDED